MGVDEEQYAASGERDGDYRAGDGDGSFVALRGHGRRDLVRAGMGLVVGGELVW